MPWLLSLPACPRGAARAAPARPSEPGPARARGRAHAPVFPPLPSGGARACAVGSASGLTPAPPPALEAIPGPCARCQQSLARGPRPSLHPRSPSPGWGPHLGPLLVSAPRPPASVRRDPLARLVGLRASSRLEPLQRSGPHSQSSAETPERGGSPESLRAPLCSGDNSGHL